MMLSSALRPSLKLLATNSFWSLVNHILARGTMVASAMILARSFDTAGFAAYSYFQLTISMLTTCTAMGIGVTASRYFSEFAWRRNDGGHPPIATLWLISILLAFLAGCIVLILPESMISPALAVPRWLMAIGVVVLALNIVPAGGVLGLEQYRSAALVSGLSSIVTLAIVLYAASASSPMTAMVATVAGGIIQFSGQAALILREIGLSELWQTFSTKKVTSIMSFAGPMFGVSILTATGTWLVGRIILSGQDGEYSFSLYVIGMQWFSFAMLLPGIFSRVIFPVLVRHSLSERSKSRNEGVTLLRKTSAIAVVMAATITMLVALLSPLIVSLYGPKFASTATALIAFSAIAILSAPANIIGSSLVANDNQRLWFVFTLVTSLLLVTSCYLTVDLGVWAGVIALTSSSGLLTFLALLAARWRGLL